MKTKEKLNKNLIHGNLKAIKRSTQAHLTTRTYSNISFKL